MKKVLPALILTSLLAVPIMVSAVTCSSFTTSQTCNDAGCMWNPDTTTCVGAGITQPGELIDLIEKIGGWVFAILLAVAAVFLVVAGFMFVTAGGNPEAVTKARQMLINALIGVAIALAARGLVALIGTFIAA